MSTPSPENWRVPLDEVLSFPGREDDSRKAEPTRPASGGQERSGGGDAVRAGGLAEARERTELPSIANTMQRAATPTTPCIALLPPWRPRNSRWPGRELDPSAAVDGPAALLPFPTPCAFAGDRPPARPPARARSELRKPNRASHVRPRMRARASTMDSGASTAKPRASLVGEGSRPPAPPRGTGRAGATAWRSGAATPALPLVDDSPARDRPPPPQGRGTGIQPRGPESPVLPHPPRGRIDRAS